jgi:hypothetical protein
MSDEARDPETDEEEAARRRRAEMLRERIEEVQRGSAGDRPPKTPREFTDRAAADERLREERDEG